jgi:hypothetical protein
MGRSRICTRADLRSCGHAPTTRDITGGPVCKSTKVSPTSILWNELNTELWLNLRNPITCMHCYISLHILIMVCNKTLLYESRYVYANIIIIAVVDWKKFLIFSALNKQWWCLQVKKEGHETIYFGSTTCRCIRCSLMCLILKLLGYIYFLLGLV